MSDPSTNANACFQNQLESLIARFEDEHSMSKASIIDILQSKMDDLQAELDELEDPESEDAEGSD